MAQAAGQCYEFGGGGPQRHLIDARMAHMSTHSQEFQAARTVLALRRPPRPAPEEDTRHHGKGFHVVNQRRFAKQAMRAGEGWFVAWFGTFVFECLEQRRLLTTTVSPRALKNLKGEVTQQSSSLALAQGSVQGLTLTGILVAQIDNDLPCPDRAGSDRHAFKHEVGQVLENQTIFERSWFTLVG